MLPALQMIRSISSSFMGKLLLAQAIAPTVSGFERQCAIAEFEVASTSQQVPGNYFWFDKMTTEQLAASCVGEGERPWVEEKDKTSNGGLFDEPAWTCIDCRVTD